MGRHGDIGPSAPSYRGRAVSPATAGVVGGGSGRSRPSTANGRASPVSWTLFTATLVALAVAAVVLLARRTRNPPVRPPR